MDWCIFNPDLKKKKKKRGGGGGGGGGGGVGERFKSVKNTFILFNLAEMSSKVGATWAMFSSEIGPSCLG